MLPCLQAFKRFLEQCERSPHTIKHYLSDLSDFAVWFEQTNGDTLTPERITPTDLREYKRGLVVQRKLKPNTVNRKLATLRTFLGWANQTVNAETVAPSRVPRPEKQIQPGPHWLDRREQNALLRAVERRHHIRDMAIIKVLLNTGLDRARRLLPCRIYGIQPGEEVAGLPSDALQVRGGSRSFGSSWWSDEGWTRLYRLAD